MTYSVVGPTGGQSTTFLHRDDDRIFIWSISSTIEARTLDKQGRYRYRSRILLPDDSRLTVKGSSCNCKPTVALFDHLD
jgi:hypothetical protein